MYHLRSANKSSNNELLKEVKKPLKQTFKDKTQVCEPFFDNSKRSATRKKDFCFQMQVSTKENEISDQNSSNSTNSSKEDNSIAGLRSWLTSTAIDYSAKVSLDNISTKKTAFKAKLRKKDFDSEIPTIVSSNVSHSSSRKNNSDVGLSSTKSLKYKTRKIAKHFGSIQEKQSVDQTNDSFLCNTPQYSPIVKEKLSSGSDSSTPVLANCPSSVSKKDLFGFEKLLQPSNAINLEHCKISPISNKATRSLSRNKKSSKTIKTISKHLKSKPSLKKLNQVDKGCCKNFNPTVKLSEKSEVELFDCSSEVNMFPEEQCNRNVIVESTNSLKPKTKQKKSKAPAFKPFEEQIIPWEDIMNHELIIE